jgi:hypothetical protein
MERQGPGILAAWSEESRNAVFLIGNQGIQRCRSYPFHRTLPESLV